MPGMLAKIHQQTVGKEKSCQGTALHSGLPVRMWIKPAPEGTGIVFRRVDEEAYGWEVRAVWQNLVTSVLCTRIGEEGGFTLSTIEHVMAALSACGIDNAFIEVSGPEVPIMDGSSDFFVQLIESAGIRQQKALCKYIEVLKPVEIRHKDQRVSIHPASKFTVEVEMDFGEKSSLLHRQCFSHIFNYQSFKEDIAPARTFTLLEEVQKLRAAGLGLGGSLENAVIIDKDRVLNEDGLRYHNECVRHKVLDAIGDLYLAGAPILGYFYGYRSGHKLNQDLLVSLLSDETAWRYVTVGRKLDACQPFKKESFVAASAVAVA